MSSTSLQHNQKTHKNARKSLCAAQIVLRDPVGERQGAIGGELTNQRLNGAHLCGRTAYGTGLLGY